MRNLSKKQIEQVKNLKDFWYPKIHGNTKKIGHYGHSDYNKHRLFAKNERTLRLMHLFNKIVNK